MIDSAWPWLSILTVVTVPALVLHELLRSLPSEHQLRRAAERLTLPMLLLAFAVLMLCAIRVASLIGYLR